MTVPQIGAPPTLGEALVVMYFNLQAEQLAYLRTSPDYDANLYASLDALMSHPLDAALLLDVSDPVAQVIPGLQGWLTAQSCCQSQRMLLSSG